MISPINEITSRKKCDLSNNEHIDAVFPSLKYQINHSDMITRWQITLMSYFYHPGGKLSHQWGHCRKILLSTTSQNWSNVDQVAHKLRNLWSIMCTWEYLFCLMDILQKIPKEFKKSHGVLVSLQPQLLWPLTYIRPSLQQAAYLVQQRIVKYHGAKLLFDCRSYILIKFRLNYLLNIFIWFEITNLYLGVAVVITWICHWNKFNFYCVIAYF